MVDITQGRGPGMVIAAVVPLGVTWIFSLIRVYVRAILLKIWKVEDWLFILSQFTFTGLSTCGLLSALHGNGQHTMTIPLHDIELALKFWYIAESFYTATALFIRLSIGCFLLRICLGKAQRWVISIAMVLMTITSMMFFVFIMIQCNPMNYFWSDYSGGHGKCFSNLTVENVTISYSVFAAACDLTLGILPLFVVWQLKINQKSKLVVGFLLALGIIAGLTVVLKIEYIHLVVLSHDFLWNTSMVAVWSIVEPAIGIVCMAASTYRPLFKSLRNKSSFAISTPSGPYAYASRGSVPPPVGHFRIRSTDREGYERQEELHGMTSPRSQRAGSTAGSTGGSRRGSMNSHGTRKLKIVDGIVMETLERVDERESGSTSAEGGSFITGVGEDASMAASLGATTMTTVWSGRSMSKKASRVRGDNMV